MPNHVAAPPSPALEALAAQVAKAKAAPFLHKGDEAGKALDQALAVLAELDRRLAAIEARFDAIEHPARTRDARGRFVPLDPPL